jgi:hypothetical protein
MKNMLKKIFSPIANFFNRIADQEAERVIEMYRQIFEVNPDKGGKENEEACSGRITDRVYHSRNRGAVNVCGRNRHPA